MGFFNQTGSLQNFHVFSGVDRLSHVRSSSLLSGNYPCYCEHLRKVTRRAEVNDSGRTTDF